MHYAAEDHSIPNKHHVYPLVVDPSTTVLQCMSILYSHLIHYAVEEHSMAIIGGDKALGRYCLNRCLNGVCCIQYMRGFIPRLLG